MLDSRRILSVFIFTAALSPLACSGEHDDASPPDHHDDGAESEEAIGSVSSPLAANATVTDAVAQSCTTTAVKGLATQLVDEIECIHPNTFAKIDNTPGLSLGSAVFPYLQTKAASALIAAQKARGITMTINSALRTLPQQFLLYRWYQTGRCGISLAATPGTSNHEGGIAVDVDDNVGWRAAMTSKSFHWLGASDPVHYDFVGAGTVDLHGVSVTAFQKLWNLNHPTDQIAEDGDYGPGTASRVAQAPANGFAKGADCKSAPAGDGGADSSAPGTTPASATAPAAPTAPEAGGDAPPKQDLTSGVAPAADPAPESSGCSITKAGGPAPRTPLTSIALGLGLALSLLVRRRRAA